MAKRLGKQRLPVIQQASTQEPIFNAGKLTVQGPGIPTIDLIKTNPGAKWGKKIYETTIDFAGTGSLGKTGGPSVGNAMAGWSPTVQNAATVWTASLDFPQNCIVNAIGVYIVNTLSGTGDPGTAGGMNFIDRIGISGSFGSINSASNDQFFMTSSQRVDGSRRIYSGSGDNTVCFPSASLVGDTYGGDQVYANGLTSSNVCLSVTLASASNSTGSVRFAIFVDRFIAPSS